MCGDILYMNILEKSVGRVLLIAPLVMHFPLDLYKEGGEDANDTIPCFLELRRISNISFGSFNTLKFPGSQITIYIHCLKATFEFAKSACSLASIPRKKRSRFGNWQKIRGCERNPPVAV